MSWKEATVGLRSHEGTPSWKNELPKLPSWKPDKVLTKAKELYKRVFFRFPTVIMDAENREYLAQELAKCLKFSRESSFLALIETLLPHDRCTMTKEIARLLCFQIVVNAKQLKDGVAIRKFTGVSKAEWVPMEILGFSGVKRGAKDLAQMHLRILDGVYAGFSAQRIMPFGFLYIFANDMGFSWKRPYEHPSDLVDMQFAAWLEPSSSEDLKFDRYWLTTAMAKHNDALVKKRKPTDKELENADTDSGPAAAGAEGG